MILIKYLPRLTGLQKLLQYIKKNNKHKKYECRYICFKKELLDLLESISCKEIKINNYSEKFKREFFKSYINLIGSLSKQFNSIYWWASFTAAKNRFASKLLSRLFEYYTICKKLMELSHSSKDILLILISPPSEILSSLKNYCKKDSIEIKIGGYFLRNFFIKCKEKLEHILRILYFILKCWYKITIVRIQFKKFFKKEFEDKSCYILRTWVYSSSFSNGNKFSDSFFGRLPDFLIKEGKKLIILAGIIGNYRKIIKKIKNCKDYIIFPEEFFLNYTDVLRAVFDCYSNRLKLKHRVKFFDIDVTKIIQDELDNDYRKFIRAELLQKYIMKNLLKTFAVKIFTTTFENNPWEKVCFLTLRELSPSTKIIGYQHAVVTEASANMFISEEEADIIPIPDKIITVGEITKNIMARYGIYPENIIKAACALRHEYIYKLNKKNFFIKKDKILIALEGVYECYKLVNLVFKALSDSKDYQIIIRPHPALPFNKIKKNLNFNIDLYNNFFISNRSLKDDLMESDIVIYWGSTVAIEALLLGIPVIHVNLDDIVSVDPLFESSYLKWIVNNERELRKAVSEIYALSYNDYLDHYKKAQDYIKRYFQEVTEDRLFEFLS